jgi:molecular chaperone HtpG
LEVFKKDSNDSLITNATEQLFESALLLEGNLNDPHKLVKRINELLEKSSDWYLGKK